MTDRAKEYAVFLIGLVSESGREFYRRLIPTVQEDETLLSDLLTEELLLQLHVVDRLAFQRLGVKGRQVFIDQLVAEVRDLMFSMYDRGDRTEFSAWFVELYNLRQKEYSGFKSFVPGENQSPKGTLFWEFAKEQCKKFPTSLNPADFLQVQLHEMHLMGSLGFAEFLEREN